MTVRRSTRRQTIFAAIALVVASYFFGMNAVASKVLFRPEGAHYDGVGLFVARSAWTLPLFLLSALATRPAAGIARADRWKFAVLALCFGPAQTAVYAVGTQLTSAAHVALLLSLSPPLTGVLGMLLLGERLTALRIGALVAGLAGAALLTFTRSSTGAHPAGDALMLVFLVSFAFFTILLRTMNGEGRYHPLFVTGVYGTLGTALLVAIGAAAGRIGAVLQPLDGSRDNAVWFFGVMVLGLSLGAQIAQVYALRSLGAGTFSVVVSYGSLLVGIAGAIFIVGERLTPLGIGAGLLLAVALGLAVAPARRLSTRESPFVRR